MFEGVNSCSLSISPNLCCCTLFMIDSLFSLDTFDIADLDSTQHIFCISRTALEVILLTKSKILDCIAFDCDSVRITLLRVNGEILSWKIVTK